MRRDLHPAALVALCAGFAAAAWAPTLLAPGEPVPSDRAAKAEPPAERREYPPAVPVRDVLLP